VDASWVLVTDGGTGQGRSALAAVRALHAGGYRAAVTISGAHSLAAASRWCGRRIPVPGADDPGFAEAVRGELASWPYTTVLPASDAALLALDAPVRRLIDKRELGRAASAVDIRSPEGEVFASARELAAAASRLPYPIIAKPTISRFTAMRVDGPDGLERMLGFDGPFLIQRFVDEPLRSVAGVLWKGRLVAAVHQRYLRTWPPLAGGACAAETIDPDLQLESRMIELLGTYQGIFHAQLAGELLLDLNPRVYGSHPLAVVAGVNLVQIACDLVSGRPAPPSVLRGRSGAFYRSLEGDIRHRIWSIRRGKVGTRAAIRSLLPRRGSAHGPESLTDPGPGLARIRYALGKAIPRTA
jgi:predicted ATP-grasp superfamily ATP-dependent carboligase